MLLWTKIKLGVAAVLLASIVGFHLHAVSAAYKDGVAAAEKACAEAKAKDKKAAEDALKARAEKLKAELEAKRDEESKRADAAEKRSEELELQLAKSKKTQCWSRETVRVLRQ